MSLLRNVRFDILLFSMVDVVKSFCQTQISPCITAHNATIDSFVQLFFHEHC